MSFRRGSLVLSALTASMMGGCVQNDVSLTIDQFVPPDPSAAAMGVCQIPGMSMFTQTRGTFDVYLDSLIHGGYVAHFVVTNNLPESTVQPIETQAYYVNSFDVELQIDGPAAAAFTAEQRAFNFKIGSVRLPPSMSQGVSARVVAGDALKGLSDSIAKGYAKMPPEAPTSSLIVAKIRPVATRAEQEVVGAFSSFPIDVCYGCLTNFTTPAPKPTFPSCPLISPKKGNACNGAQDDPVECCTLDKTSPPRCGSAAAVAVPDAAMPILVDGGTNG